MINKRWKIYPTTYFILYLVKHRYDNSSYSILNQISTKHGLRLKEQTKRSSPSWQLVRQSSLKINTRSPGSFLLFVEFSLCKYGRNVRPVQTAWWFYCYLWSHIDDWWGSQPNPIRKLTPPKQLGRTELDFMNIQHMCERKAWSLLFFLFCFYESALSTLIIKVDYVRRSRFHSSTTSFFMALLRLLNFSDFKNLHDRVMGLMTIAVKLYIYKKRAFVLFSTGEVLIWPTFYAYSSSLSTSPK